MSEKTVYVSRFAAWAPGLSSLADWDDWARGAKEIESSSESPPLDFAESKWLKLSSKEFALFKRRQSQISRMAIHVLHEIMPIGENAKTAFVSFRGEIAQQFKINKMIIEEGDISPSAFSQSVFNTPPALAAIALGLEAGYSAIYPGDMCFCSGFLAAAAPLFAGSADSLILLYADELCPAEYGSLCPQPDKPFAFAAELSAHGEGIPVLPAGEYLKLPENFLKFLCQNRDKL
ncbi:MAG: beta-ketoacyl synthase chain length factor [Treponema sp.]|jgi:hypothetical protein|nr:beta-ketoacyl synthase chain length factor [Treponema sp.]